MRLLLLPLFLLAGVWGCKTVVSDPCQDTAVVIESKGSPVACHPQAGIAASPIGSAGVVLVTCRCNILPNPAPVSCEIGAHDAGSE